MAKLVNLTPHPVVVGGITLDPAGPVPRLTQTTRPVGRITVQGQDVTVTESALGQLTGLPEPQDGTYLIVSRTVAEAVPHRRDLMIPGAALWDEAGRIIGFADLARVPAPVGTVPAALLLVHLAPEQVTWYTGADSHVRPAPVGAADLGDYESSRGEGESSNGFSFQEIGLDGLLAAVDAGETVYLEMPGGLHDLDTPPLGVAPRRFEAWQELKERHPRHVVLIERVYPGRYAYRAIAVRLDVPLPKELHREIPTVIGPD
ncbi:hypothetical protein AB0J86_33465 [Micromonospora sp. NPDC049559]|uniref:hypothetical protein n=1 Tax=Micromonospora sp. NPDC049559 TaxID=3155923 RepID=UPI00341DF819